MKKAKYYYNKQTLRYERIEEGLGKKLGKGFVFMASSLFFAAIIVVFAYYTFDSVKEKQLKREIAQLQFQNELLQENMELAGEVLDGLVERDNNIYRTIFEAEPISDDIRTAGTGGVNKYSELSGFENEKLMKESAQKMDQLKRQLYIQSRSYDELKTLIDQKEEMLASIPAIQPIANTDLKRMASGFGFRIHPIYKTRKMHWGLDFTAPTGTDIFCTGDGVVKAVKYSRNGYGNHVVIDHGYGYESLYAHMHKATVRKGQKVKRGDVLGLVGNTGTSTAPHLHYEIFRNGQKIDPINFFFNDLTDEEYEKMIEISASHNQSFD